MRPVIKLLALAALLVASGAIGAGIYALVDNEAEAAVQTNGPRLVDTQAVGLVGTYLKRVSAGPIRAWALCPTDTTVTVACLGNVHVADVDEAVFAGNGLWVVTNMG